MKINLGMTHRAEELLRRSEQRTTDGLIVTVAYSGDLIEGGALMILGWHEKERVNNYVIDVGPVKVAILLTDEILDYFNSCVLDFHIDEAALVIRERVRNDIDDCRNVVVSVVATKLLH